MTFRLVSRNLIRNLSNTTPNKFSTARYPIDGSRYMFSFSQRLHSHDHFDENAERITVHFIDLKKDGEKKTVQARVGSSVLETTREFGIELEGACEASLACSTCHCYIPMEYHDSLPEPEEAEEDMLDMAYGLQEESRLGCQIRFTKDLEGVTITLPRATRNYYVDKERKS